MSPRIIAGEFGGRPLILPADRRVRPTADRIREAWMSILGARLAGATVLDLFAGSGALGLEALSRGAAEVSFVDLNPPSIAAVRANAAALGVTDRITVRRGDALRFVERLPAGAFDLALADPPYNLPWAERLIRAFRTCPFAGVLAVEHPARAATGADEIRHYGEIALSFCYAP